MALALKGAGITNLIDLMSLRHEVVPTLVYRTRKDEETKSLKFNDVGMIQTFITYGRHLMQANHGVLSIEQWDSITREEFDSFRICGSEDPAATELVMDHLNNVPMDAHLDPIEGEMSSKSNSD